MSKKFSVICALAAVLAVMSARVAKADGMDTFTYVSDGNTFVWQLPSSPTPDSVDPFGNYFTISAMYSENDATPVLGTFDFFILSEFGGLDLYQGGYPPPFYFINSGFGPQVFTGSINAPTFVPGPYSFTDFAISDDGVPGTLTIAGVPEPSTIGLLAIGLVVLALGFSFGRANAARIQS
jgi:hypothetical protein